MRRVEDSGSAVPPRRHRPGARWSVRGLPVSPLFAVMVLGVLVSPYLGLNSREIDPRIAEVWPGLSFGFVVIAAVWRAGRSRLLGTLLAMTLVFVVTALVMGETPWHSVWWALCSTAGAAAMVAIYRCGTTHDGWTPETPRDVLTMLLGALGVSAATALLGGFPSVAPFSLHEATLWWIFRNSVYGFVGATCFMILLHRRDRGPLEPSRWVHRVLLAPTIVVCLYGTFYDPHLPLTWLMLVPSVWGGMTVTLRGAAYVSQALALSAALVTYFPQNQYDYSGVLPPSSIMDLLVTASTAFTLLLTINREQRALLIDQLDAKHAESESQRELLSTVFESMSDGVMLLSDGRITMHNGAARQLLGRPLPATLPVSWVRGFDLRSPGGGEITDAAIQEALANGAGGHDRTLELFVGRGGHTRALEITVRPVGRRSDGAMMVLITDVTAQRARTQQLTSFAGTVAHDLRNPLTVLDGWLEVALDARAGDEEDAASVDDALSRAKDASKRMRQVIEDWLSYTVVQHGQLRPVPVRLDRLTSEIVEVHRSRLTCAGEPEFDVQVPHAVEADPGMLRQLLDNVVSNAIKYTPEDRVPSVSIRSQPDEEPGWIRVDVSDRGAGIPSGQEERIFEEFVRGEEPGRSVGTGLGLALTRRIVALHGGQMTARRNGPADDAGSTFTFTLPAA